MKRLAILLLAVAACRSTPSYSSNGQLSVATGSQLTGAGSPREAVQGFLAAVHAQDLQAMAMVWGSTKGPARDVVEHSQLEKRELIMQCYLNHDSYQILSDTRANGGAAHSLVVALTKGTLTRQTTFVAVKGPSERWYVQDVPLEPVRDLCAAEPSGALH